MKLSAVIHRVNGQVVTGLAPSYRDRLDRLIDVFGEDRILFGSDWPNSDGVAPIDSVVGVVRDISRPGRARWPRSISGRIRSLPTNGWRASLRSQVFESTCLRQLALPEDFFIVANGRGRVAARR